MRFLVGGTVALGDVLKPKSFAGLFGASPSVALAMLALTIVSEGLRYAAIEARSMIAGALALFAYASLASWVMVRYTVKALVATMSSMPLSFGVAFGIWPFWIR